MELGYKKFTYTLTLVVLGVSIRVGAGAASSSILVTSTARDANFIGLGVGAASVSRVAKMLSTCCNSTLIQYTDAGKIPGLFAKSKSAGKRSTSTSRTDLGSARGLYQ